MKAKNNHTFKQQKRQSLRFLNVLSTTNIAELLLVGGCTRQPAGPQQVQQNVLELVSTRAERSADLEALQEESALVYTGQ